MSSEIDVETTVKWTAGGVVIAHDIEVEVSVAFNALDAWWITDIGVDYENRGIATEPHYVYKPLPRSEPDWLKLEGMILAQCRDQIENEIRESMMEPAYG